jgi:virginiamycin A acetyltransferase
MICRMEGGQMWSPTYRELMRQHYGVEIGMYSYGPALWPGGLPEGTRIGNYCSLAAGITVFRRNHPTNRVSQHPFFFNSAVGLIKDDSIHADRDQPLIVEHDVWIGANAIITPRCKFIGLGAVIGAGAVVTKDVPPFAIVGGIPAHRIGARFPDEIQQALLECRWWEYPINRLTPLLRTFQEEASLENVQLLQSHLHSSPSQK